MDPEIQQQPGGGPAIGDYLGVFTRRAWLIVIPFLVVLSLAAALGFLLPAQYEGRTVVQVDDTSEIQKLYRSVDFNLPHKEALTTVKQVILRRRFLEPIVDRYDIREGFDVGNPRDKTRLFDHIKQNLGVKLLQQKDGPDVITIGYQGRDARKVCAFVNEVRSAYVSYILQERRRTVAQVRDDLIARYDAAKERAEKAAEAYMRFQEEEEIQLVGDKTLANKHIELNRVVQTLEDERTRRDNLAEQLDAVRADLLEQNEKIQRSTKKVLNERFLEQQKKVAALEQELQTMLERGLLRTIPQVAALERKIQVEQQALAGIERFVENERVEDVNPVWQTLKERESELQTTLLGSKAKIASLERRRDELKEQVDRIPQLTRRELELRTRRDNALESVAIVGRRLNAARGLWDRVNSDEGNFFKPLEMPVPENADTWDPVFPNVPLFIGIGAFIGLLIGTGLAFLVEFSSSAFLSISQVRRTLPLPVLGQIGTLETPAEIRSRRLRRAVVWTGVLAIAALLVYAHTCYFTRDLQGNLPTWLFTVMKRFYGAQ